MYRFFWGSVYLANNYEVDHLSNVIHCMVYLSNEM